MNKININSKTIKNLDNLTYTMNQLLFDCGDDVEISFEQDNYDFDPIYAYEAYTYVTNNDHGNKRMAFPILNKRKIIIDGNGSSFIFKGRMIPFFLKDCDNIVLKNFTIDVDRAFYTQGITVESDLESVTLDIDKSEFPYNISNNRLNFYGEYYQSDFVHEFIEFEAEDKRPIDGCEDFFVDDYVEAVELENGFLKIFYNFHRLPVIGKMMVIKHERRLIPGIVMDHCNDVQLENINIRQAGTMGLVAQYCENITLRNINVSTDPNSKRVVSTNTDATHFVGCRGKIVVEDCLFESQLDDAINVHGNYLILEKRVDDCSLIAKIGHYQQQGIFGLIEGTTINLIDTKTMYVVEQWTLKSKKILNRGYVLLTFNEPIRLKEGNDYCIEDEDAYPELVFRNNVVRKNRARGLLLSSRKKMLIENNLIISESTAIKISGDTDFWYESGPVSDVIIRNNRIESINDNQVWGTALIDIDPEMVQHMEDKHYHGKIIFENNIISPGKRPLVYGHSFKNLVFKDNKYNTEDLEYRIKQYQSLTKG